MKKSVFKIPKMDCPSEERLIRMAIDDIGQIEYMEFNLLNRTAILYHCIDPEEITQMLKPLNLGAEHVLTEKLDDNDTEKLAKQNSKTEEQQRGESKVLWILLVVNGFMFCGEIVYGFIAQSTGLIADAMDMFADAAVYGISLFAVGKSVKLQKKAAKISGFAQLFLALFAFTEVVRRFVYGSDPHVISMIVISIIALIANVFCLILITKQRSDTVHMKASVIFSANDVIANCGVILAAILVMWTGNNLPDLFIGLVIALVVSRGAFSILKLSSD